MRNTNNLRNTLLGAVLSFSIVMPAQSNASEPELINGLIPEAISLTEEDKIAARGQYFKSKTERDNYCYRWGYNPRCKTTGTYHDRTGRAWYWSSPSSWKPYLGFDRKAY